MKFNSDAKVHIKILLISLLAFCFLAIPAVMAMSVDQVVALRPYGAIALLFGMGSAIISFAQRKFYKIKRVVDITGGAIGLILSAPFILVFAVLIKGLSPKGPIFYTQGRVGKDGKIFKIYKLRSMKPDAEQGTGAVWAASEARDPRVIPFIGDFLRKSHIDETPQFFNVLKGDMSVVGPRPERPDFSGNL